MVFNEIEQGADQAKMLNKVTDNIITHHFDRKVVNRLPNHWLLSFLSLTTDDALNFSVRMRCQQVLPLLRGDVHFRFNDVATESVPLHCKKTSDKFQTNHHDCE
jgi:hypothetical protein